MLLRFLMGHLATLESALQAQVKKLQVAGIAEVAGALRVTESGTAQHILIGNQDSSGTDKPAMIRGVNGPITFRSRE